MGNIPPLIGAMLRPDFYPHATADAIALVQTHISYVLLTGAYAYKVKKPVELGFADFSTLERRRHFCEEELRLNRRGAPTLYCGVHAITRRGDGGFELDGAGEAVEYAVRMRQFPGEALFSELADRGGLGEAVAIELARTVAEYHMAAPTDARVAAFGAPARVREAIEDNYGHTRRFVRRYLQAEQFERTRAFTEAFFERHAALLAARVTGGAIRECHGDLHLANVCRWEGRIVLFDCIEFNDTFRLVDVMYDVAFAAMDLTARRRQDLATAFVNEYAERTGDWAGLGVLRLYLCRQAYVRGKVNSILADEGEADEGSRVAAAQAAGRYFQLASDYATPRAGRLILMSGLSGSGKSTVAHKLATRIGAVHIRSDAVRKHMLGVPLAARAGADGYTPEVTRQVYERLLELGLMLTAQGYAVILDARYDRRGLRRSAFDRADASRVPVTIYHCVAPDDVLRARLAARQGDPSDATAELLEEQRAATEAYDETEVPRVRVIDTTGSVERQVEALR